MDLKTFKQGTKYKLVYMGEVLEYGRLFMKSENLFYLIRKHAYDVAIPAKHLKFLQPLTSPVHVGSTEIDDLPF